MPGTLRTVKSRWTNLAAPPTCLKTAILWVRAVRILGIDGMPPQDHDDRPSPGQRQKMVDWLAWGTSVSVDCDVVDDSGRVTIHRLNRTEYNNTIRDLLGVDMDVTKDFPSDDVGYGFSNIADHPGGVPLRLQHFRDGQFLLFQDGAESIDAVDNTATSRIDSGKKPVTRSGTGGDLANAYR